MTDGADSSQHRSDSGQNGSDTSRSGSGGSSNDTDYQLGVALVSILISITASVGFGVYSVTSVWWIAVLSALGAPTLLALLIRLGGEDGAIPQVGRWVLGGDR